MQIIVIGCGKVGRELVAQLSREKNNVTVIDTKAEKVKIAATNFDVKGIVGNGTSYQILKEAGIETADILIAVTYSDEVNILCCVLAKKTGNCQTIARVRNPIYSEERYFLQKELGISMIVNPERSAAWEIARLLRFPSAIEIDTFAKGRIEMLRCKVPEKSGLIGSALKEVSQKIQKNVLVCVVQRKGEVYIPDGNFVIERGDILSVIAIPGDTNDFFKKCGIRVNQVKNTMIIGGGEVSYYLAMILIKMGIEVKIIEKNREKCEELSDLLPKATIIHGDGSDQELLSEERLELMDSFVACTDIDEENMILSLYAIPRVKSKVVTKLNRVEFNDVINSLDLDSIIYPKNITSESILQYVRAMGNTVGNSVETLYRLMDGRVEALEFLIRGNSRICGIKLQDMKLKKNILIAGIVRKGQLIIPGGQDYFMAEDSVIVVTTNTGYQDINDIIAD